MSENDTEKEGSFGDLVSAEKKIKTKPIPTTSDNAVYNGPCRHCGERLRSVEVVNNKVKCPACNKDF